MTAATQAASNSASRNKNMRMAEENLAAEVEGLRKDLQALTERFSTLSDAGLRTAREFKDETASAARQKGEEVYSELHARASELEQQAADQIRRHPLQALGVAAGIGFLAALLTRR